MLKNTELQQEFLLYSLKAITFASLSPNFSAALLKH